MLQCYSLTFHESKNFLLTEAVCFGGLRVVIPEKYRVRLLDDLH